MPSNRKSPFTTSFNSAIKRGVPCGTAVQQISKRTGKTPTFIFNSLFNAGSCKRAKVNGQWIYWPTTSKKSNSSTAKQCQVKMWQNFVDWCIASGNCTTKQFNSNCSNATKFWNFCSKNFNKMHGSSWTSSFSSSSSTSSSSSKKSAKKNAKKSTPKKNTKKRTTKSKSKKTTWARSSKTTKSYKFPSIKSRKTSTKKYRQAA